MRVGEYAVLDATAIAALVRDGQVTPAEVFEVARAAVESVNPEINAVIETYSAPNFPDPAQCAPFIGVPVALKDIGTTERGRLCEQGSRLARGCVAERDTELMRRFNAAGLFNIGRTTTSEFAIAATVETALNGRTLNPWDPLRSAGGSSGGAAAAVAAGMLPIAHAADGGGSIRMPASACGVVGLKPSRGRVSTAPNTVVGDMVAEFAVTRSVRDTAALLDAVAGPATGDPFVIPASARPYVELIREAPRQLRIGLCTENLWGGLLDPEVAEATRGVAQTLANLGHVVEEISLGLPIDRYVSATLNLWSASNAATAARLTRAAGRPVDRETVEGLTYSRIMHGRTLAAEDVIEALHVLNDVRGIVGAAFEPYDMMVAPTMPRLPPSLGEYDPAGHYPPHWYYSGPVGSLEAMGAIFNCTGQPAISLPLAESTAGLPIGVQLISRFADEGTLLQVSAALEQVRPWSHRLPGVHVSRQGS